MRKNIYKTVSLIISMIIILTLIVPNRAYAMSGNVTFDPRQGVFDQGGQYKIKVVISGSETFSFEGNISVSGGATFDHADDSLESAKGTYIISPSSNGLSGYVYVNVGGTGTFNIAVSGVMLSADSGEQINVSGGASFSIRSAADKAAQEEAARKASQEEAARQASIWAEESSRQASIWAEESSRQAVIQASVDAENASIAAEQSKQASIEAESAAVYNSSVAESASIEESSRLESASIEESKEEESKRESRSAAAESRSVYESSSMEELTRAFEVKGTYYVPYDLYAKRERFLFATADTEVPVPEHFTKVPLTVNKQEVLAYQLDGFSENIYIVYGCFEDEDTEPELYLYDAETDRLFPYEALGLDEEDAAKNELALTALTATATPVRKGMNLGFSLVEIFLGILLGAAILLLTLTLLHKKQDKEAQMAAYAAAGEADGIPYAEPEPVSGIQEAAALNDAALQDEVMQDTEFTEAASVLLEDSVFEALNEGEEASTPSD